MELLAELGIVFLAGLVTALATGLGALPFFFIQDIGNRWKVLLWGLASGIMLSASGFGLIREGLTVGTPTELATGLGAGVVLVIVAHQVLSTTEVKPHHFEEADYRKLILILGILTVHSFPEGISIGVSFAELGSTSGVDFLGFSIPLLAVFMTIAISIHNIPEGVAISIPLQSMGVSNWRLVWWSVFSSLPQPIGAVVAFYFAEVAGEFLTIGFGFAAGAMVYLVLSEFIPEALDQGKRLPHKGRLELISGLAIGILGMVPLIFI